jgi:alkylation response protein AidB-like acyl-CoA dehydrogenase
MEFFDSPDQAALRSATSGFLAQQATSARVRAAMADPLGYDRSTWKRLGDELGLMSLVVPEQFGGAGATLAEVAVVIEELGRVLLPSPYLSTVLVSSVLADAAPRVPDLAAEFLPGLATGAVVGAFALSADVVESAGRLTGRAQLVVDGAQADLFLVRAGRELFAVRASDVVVAPVDTLDQTRGQATVSFDGAPGVGLGPLADRAEDLLRMALAVEAVGSAREALDRTVEYLKIRVQFGKPIGSFQALKHRCADLAVSVESARATALAAVGAAIGPATMESGVDFATLAPLAKLHCTRVLRQVAGEMIQLHGGIGFTWEHDAHLFFKRAKSSEVLYGTPSQLRRLVGERSGLIGAVPLERTP